MYAACICGTSVEGGIPRAPTLRRQNQGPLLPGPGREHSCAGRGLGSPPPPGLALRRKESRPPLPSAITSGLQHLPHEAGANQSQMWEQQKMLIILTRKSPIYKEIMK